MAKINPNLSISELRAELERLRERVAVLEKALQDKIYATLVEAEQTDSS